MNTNTEFPMLPNIKITKIGIKCRYNVYEYIPYTSAKICVVILDQDDIGIDSKFFILDTNNGFLDWGNDDSFLTKWIKIQLAK